MAQLLEYRVDLTDTYRALFPALVAPALWENHGNCPALIRFIEAYIERGTATIDDTQLEHLLG